MATSSESAEGKPQLLVINTIGLTGAEILAADLAKLPSVFVLPGHNFIEDRRLLYRAHDYLERSAEDTFDNLSLHQYTTGGRCWAGLTKHMNDSQKSRYDVNLHRQIFIERLGASREFTDVITQYILSYFASMNIDVSCARYLAFYGPNTVLAYHDQIAKRRIKVINWHNRIDLWLANIGQRMTWDNLSACKFWIVNSLYQMWYESENPDFLMVDMQEYIESRPSSLSGICNFLDLPAPKANENNPASELGFIEFSTAFYDRLSQDAKILNKIYSGCRPFRLAEGLSVWSKECLAKPEVIRLLEAYRKYWNSTGHTNFDWIGPLENKIYDAVMRAYPVPDESNPSIDFYHRQIRVNSDNYDSPECFLAHSLGNLEEDIVLPLQPVFLRAAIAYVLNIAHYCASQAHSYYPLRRGSLYQRITSADARPRILALGLADKLAEMEAAINSVEEKIGQSIRTWPR